MMTVDLDYEDSIQLFRKLYESAYLAEMYFNADLRRWQVNIIGRTADIKDNTNLELS